MSKKIIKLVSDEDNCLEVHFDGEYVGQYDASDQTSSSIAGAIESIVNGLGVGDQVDIVRDDCYE